MAVFGDAVFGDAVFGKPANTVSPSTSSLFLFQSSSLSSLGNRSAASQSNSVQGNNVSIVVSTKKAVSINTLFQSISLSSLDAVREIKGVTNTAQIDSKLAFSFLTSNVSIISLAQLSDITIQLKKTILSLHGFGQQNATVIAALRTVPGIVAVLPTPSNIFILFEIGATSNLSAIQGVDEYVSLGSVVHRGIVSLVPLGSRITTSAFRKINGSVILAKLNDTTFFIAERSILSSTLIIQDVSFIRVRDVLVLVPDVVFDLITVSEIIDIIKGL